MQIINMKWLAAIVAAAKLAGPMFERVVGRVFASTFSRCSVREKCCSTMVFERDTMFGLIMDLSRLSHYLHRS
jgi:hypothetical protein